MQKRPRRKDSDKKLRRRGFVLRKKLPPKKHARKKKSVDREKRKKNGVPQKKRKRRDYA